MKWKTVFLLAVGGSIFGPSAAWASCDSAFGYLFMRTGNRPFAVSGALQVQPGSRSDATFLNPSLDVSLPLGSRTVLKPMVGICTTSDEGGDTEILYGGGGALNFWNNRSGTLGLNLQAAATAYTFDGGSDVVAPVSIMGLWEASDAAGLVFGGGVQLDRFHYPGIDLTDTNSEMFGTVGGLFSRGSAGFQAGLVIKTGEFDTDVALNAAVTLGLN